jgi:RNA polymerase sigma factor (sigma-70 family)
MQLTHPEYDDQALMRRVRTGDPAAEQELYRVHAGVALRRAAQLGAQHADAEDFVAEAFLRVLRQLRKGNGPNGPFGPYLYAALRNLAADAHRGQRGRERPTEEMGTVTDRVAAGPDPQDEIETRLSIQAAMQRLPARWREILWRVHVEGHSTAALAAEFGASTQAISALAYRARKALRCAYAEAEHGVEAAGTNRTDLPRSA